jgi:hypothetical protein
MSKRKIKLSPEPQKPNCAHDYVNPRQLGEFRFVCPKCGEDISFKLTIIKALSNQNKQKNYDY